MQTSVTEHASVTHVEHETGSSRHGDDDEAVSDSDTESDITEQDDDNDDDDDDLDKYSQAEISSYGVYCHIIINRNFKKRTINKKSSHRRSCRQPT